MSRFRVRTRLISGLGLAFGYGIKPLIREMYRHLAELHQEPDDRIYLFGFSRGAFAVRALAGLIYRCGLPEPAAADFRSRFRRAWRLFKPISQHTDRVARFRATGQRNCTIEFFGVWDTVKSYGGLVPVKLPHLRHNPIVRHVAHALALHERRAWFKATTWGQLDLDTDRAMTRVDDRDRPRYTEQTIAEVWFTGFHSDVGCGDIFNDDRWPYRRWVWGSDGARQPAQVQRKEQVTVHPANTDVAAVGPHEPWRPDSTPLPGRPPAAD